MYYDSEMYMSVNTHLTVSGARGFETNRKSDMIYETLLNQWPKFNNPALGTSKETSIQKRRRYQTNQQHRALPKCVQCYSCFQQCRCSFPCPPCWRHEWPESRWASSGIWKERFLKWGNTFFNETTSVWTQHCWNCDTLLKIKVLQAMP